TGSRWCWPAGRLLLPAAGVCDRPRPPPPPPPSLPPAPRSRRIPGSAPIPSPRCPRPLHPGAPGPALGGLAQRLQQEPDPAPERQRRRRRRRQRYRLLTRRRRRRRRQRQRQRPLLTRTSGPSRPRRPNSILFTFLPPLRLPSPQSRGPGTLLPVATAQPGKAPGFAGPFGVPGSSTAGDPGPSAIL
ncbi:hypothetical protein MC885_005387, partial [Smutsia gigantea]